MAFKMKGSPMQRNFGIGSPAKKTNGPTTIAANIYQGAKDIKNFGKAVWEGLKTGHTGKSNRKTGGFMEGYNKEKTSQSKDTNELQDNLNKYPAYPQPGD